MVDKLKHQDFKRLEELIKLMERSLQNHDYIKFNADNRAFHFTIYEATSNSYLMNMIAGMWDLAERYRYRYLVLRDQAEIIQQEHQMILDACLRRDAAGLRNAIVAHMNRTFEGIRSHLTTNVTPNQ